ncbi:hypothetical protein LPTSP4_15050 [Leptospira ryugenii]|uniref:WG repeat-containing protein n=1 Tax=Leptospira ryugenii TaxID=1917863 RepID=A0A2P2DZC4_9LEPT|nr:WG repeat-containing protein [Leptospira ryugenii]GBF49984.1 hypothetical protein LPTSP4_15050 [Leptospira ryugenii]
MQVLKFSIFFVLFHLLLTSLDSKDITSFHKEIVGKVEYNKYGIAIILREEGWFAIDKKKKILYQVYTFDNGPDYISDGLYRIVDGSKFGFANEKGKVIVPPKYDFVWPFEDKRAQVCIGCRFRKVGEHTEIITEGATVFSINQSGKEISK